MSSAQYASDSFLYQANNPGAAATSAEPPPPQPQPPPQNENVPRPKRMACILCRKRKLKCDGSKPSCATCSRLGHKCEYSEERKKSGPKRGYVKLLEARLKQVENLLETLETPAAGGSTGGNSGAAQLPLPSHTESTSIPQDDNLHIPTDQQIPPLASNSMEGIVHDAFIDPNLDSLPDFGLNSADGAFSWDMIGLGLEEALPDQDTIDELTQIYFEKIHPSVPMIHRGRFLASMKLAPNLRPCVALRYIMWALACSITSKYSALAEHFYTRARKYAESDEMRGHGESVVSLTHCQTWALICNYEFRHMYFPRAWMSTGRAARLALMMGLHRQDRAGLDVKQTIAPPRDWLDREERRRTFWVVFCQDRYASIGTGWPMELDERDFLTNLPASEEAFLTGKNEDTQPLCDVLNGESNDSLSSFAGVILLATIYGRNLTHLHRPNEGDNDHDLNGEFWKRHRNLDNTLLNISLSMPAALRLPTAITDPNAVFCNMNIHSATICLHQAAIFKVEKNRLPLQIGAESKRRCVVAADQVTNIMKMISHLDLSMMNPFLAFCLYVSARVFVQYLKSRKEDSAVKSSLEFLLSAMQVIKAKNPITESFLIQLEVDIEGSGIDIPSHFRHKSWRHATGEVPANADSVRCSAIFQTVGQTSREHADESTSTAHSNRVCGKEPSCLTSHLTDVTFDGSDILYNSPLPQQQPQQPQHAAVSGSSDSTGSHSNFPTPQSSSNRHSSHTGHSPYQHNSFSPLSTGSASTSTNNNNSNNSNNSNSNSNNHNNSHNNAAQQGNANTTTNPAATKQPVDHTFSEQLVFGNNSRTPSVTTWNFKSPNQSVNTSTSSGHGPQHQQPPPPPPPPPQQQQQQNQDSQNVPVVDGFPFPSLAAAGRGGGARGEGQVRMTTGMTPLSDTEALWQSVMDTEGDWVQGWTPGAM